MSLDRQKLEALVAQNITLHIYETLPSTNQTLWKLIKQGAKPGSVVIATQQTAGRGQRGHQWYSAIGGLYLSYALAPNIPVSESFQLTLRTAWGIATTLQTLGIPVQLKWLNDLVIDGRKLGGILTETKVNQGIITKAVVGVGINWTNPVPETGVNLSSFINIIPDLEMLAAITIQGIETGINKPIASLIPSYEQLLLNIGQKVTVGDRPGVIIGITDTCCLRVQIEDAEVHLKPGSISLGYK
ncbi:biotin--[acetyl-CoA-carboxylase] ligase [Synechocystis sp. PCC 7509]|uniref:biotin--[acetyl-CoA-carboxylase] ligase n=1 Tax=Synechocystis sp. PCC 7509 TaxID=927677 RepID=UPI0002ABED5B|nr:biotin--[acetyl-CoA-carboxylase] ligase [Synechocystis sp. PCC 7509]